MHMNLLNLIVLFSILEQCFWLDISNNFFHTWDFNGSDD